MAINVKGIIYLKKKSNITSIIFGEFIDNLSVKLIDTQKENSLIILDNKQSIK